MAKKQQPVESDLVGNDLPPSQDEDLLERNLRRRYTRIVDEVNQLEERVRLDTRRLRELRPQMAKLEQAMRQLGLEAPKVPKVSEVIEAGVEAAKSDTPRPQRGSDFLEGVRRGITFGRRG